LTHINAVAPAFGDCGIAQRLPNANAAMLDHTISAGTEGPAKRPIVAIVDDDMAVCSSLKFSLELEGFAVRTYHSGSELLNARDLGLCQCFVIDQRMPQMSGMEVADALRSREIAAPVILIISDPSIVLSNRAAKASIPIVEKPLLGNALIERIREACGLN
jgi:two-component system, LuxR family, response regulator FixJ